MTNMPSRRANASKCFDRVHRSHAQRHVCRAVSDEARTEDKDMSVKTLDSGELEWEMTQARQALKAVASLCETRGRAMEEEALETVNRGHMASLLWLISERFDKASREAC